jgi:hypothetical protein
MVGTVPTFTVTVDELTHKPLTPVTVYVVVVVGITVTEDPLNEPGIQVYEYAVADVAVRTAAEFTPFEHT